MIFTKCSHAIASHISPDAAWVFGVIEYWSQANARKKKQQSLKNGLYCCYLSLRDWQRELPFLSRSKIQDCLKSLRDSGVIVIFDGDKESGRANYYAVDQKGWLKFQTWSSGHVLSAEDGKALTPPSQQVVDATDDNLVVEDVVEIRHIPEKMLLDSSIDVVGFQHIDMLDSNKMAHTLDIKSSYKELTEIRSCSVGRTDRTQPPKKPKQPFEGSLIFEAYKEAYAKRYGQDPLRNAKVNSVCSQIAKQVGIEIGQAVMHFYLQQNVAWYVQKAHAIEYALKDLQALRTNMLNNQAMSARQAQALDKQQAQKNALENYLANREKYAFK